MKRLIPLVIACLALLACGSAQTTRPVNSQLTWSGYAWAVRSGKGNPGSCRHWNPQNVEVDSHGHLHLKVAQDCAEIHSEQYTGYGTYSYSVLSDLRHLDPSVVLGLFTYDELETHAGNSEIDVEVGRVNDFQSPDPLTFSVQPTTSDLTRREKTSPLGPPPYTVTFVWAPTQVTFVVTDVTGAVHTFVGTDLPAPPAKTTRAYVNLWHNKSPRKPVEVVLGSFHYARGGL